MDTCSSCGAPAEERTRGCKACANRHNRWRRAGDPRAIRSPGYGLCGRCGGSLLARNLTCKTCAHRHDHWVLVGDSRGIPRPRKACKGCGGNIDTYTDGCKLCTRRKKTRARKEAKEREAQGAAPLPAPPAELVYRPAPAIDPVPEDTLDSPRDIENLHNLQSWLSARRARLTKKH